MTACTMTKGFVGKTAPLAEKPPVILARGAMDVARLTVVANEPEAELLCSLLRGEGIECFYKRSDFSAGAWGLGSVGGPIEVWVSEGDVQRGRALLDGMTPAG